MPKTLHITNGDCAAESIRSNPDIKGDVLSWMDILTEGPLLDGRKRPHSLYGLSNKRARYLASRRYRDYATIRNMFYRRDNEILDSVKNYDEIVLWFTDTLHDQLQMLQVLNHYSRCRLKYTRLYLICCGHYEFGDKFRGFSQLKPEDFLTCLARYKMPMIRNHLRMARDIWFGICDDNPNGLFSFADDYMINDLHYICDALFRHQLEFPFQENGVGFLHLNILKHITRGIETPRALFKVISDDEWSRRGTADDLGCAPIGHGDMAFYKALQDIMYIKEPLVRFHAQNAIFHPNKKLYRA